MKLKTKAFIGMVLLPCALFGFLFNQHMNEDLRSESVRFVPVHQEQLAIQRLSNIGHKSGQESQECVPTKLSMNSPDFTSCSIMDKIRFNTTYKVILSKDDKRKLKERTKDTKTQRLNVIVIPHSQNDPGRLQTFEKLFAAKSKNILNLIVKKLSQYPNMSFIWAETSVLALWWEQQQNDTRQKFISLIKSGRLEIVSGGWVIPDEACTHYHDVIQQLIEGHQWVYKTLGVKPRVNWAVDTVGHSETMPYLLKLAGFRSMVIGRVHTAIKPYLRTQHKLEFNWRQFWDPKNHTDIACHILPYASANTMDTCGPDSSVCKTFDFVQSPPIPETMLVDDPDFIVMASALYEQYRATSKAFLHNTIFVPIGGEFRWSTEAEWDKHYKGYTNIFDYMNRRKDWNVSVKFGTLSDYYNAVNTSALRTSKISMKSALPVFSGDFFPYSDKDNAYWTGYYSSRSWIKFIGREVQSALRTASILHVMACVRSPHDTFIARKCQKFGKTLEAARKRFSFFQHHDAITGTSRPHVVEDYYFKLLGALNRTQAVNAWAVPTLMLADISGLAETRPAEKLPHGLSVRESPEPAIRISKTQSYKVVLFNPLPIERLEAVTLRVNNSQVTVSCKGIDIQAQVIPVLNLSNVVNSSVFDVSFSVTVPALGMETVWLHLDGKNNTNKAELSQISVKSVNRTFQDRCPFPVKTIPSFREIVIENDCLKLEFEGRTGLLKEVFDKTSNRKTTVDIDFVNYTPYQAGAYVFQARVEAHSFAQSDKINVLVSRGPQVSTVQVIHPIFRHTIKLYHTSGAHCRAIHVDNVVQLVNTTDFELVMRIKTDVMNSGVIYTDENGFQMVKRVRRSNLPLGANLFPMTNMAFIQNRARRVTLHSFQPLAVSSIKDGLIDVLLDRTVADSDKRGLGEGLSSPFPTLSKFYLLLEETSGKPTGQKPALPTLFSYQLNDILQSPLLAVKYSHDIQADFQNTRLGLLQPLPCDFHIVSFRELPLYENDLFNAAVIVHKRGYTCGSPLDTFKCAREWKGLKFSSLLPDTRINAVSEWTLSYLDKLDNKALTDTIEMSPMTMRAFHFRWQ